MLLFVMHRTILPSGREESSNYHSQYKIDDKVVGRESYLERLGAHGVLVKARNFLVFQGDIESVAQMNPKVQLLPSQSSSAVVTTVQLL